MTRKHFVALASEIASINDDLSRRAAAFAVARACAKFNQNFDRARFLSACGIFEI